MAIVSVSSATALNFKKKKKKKGIPQIIGCIKAGTVFCLSSSCNWKTAIKISPQERHYHGFLWSLNWNLENWEYIEMDPAQKKLDCFQIEGFRMGKVSTSTLQ